MWKSTENFLFSRNFNLGKRFVFPKSDSSLYFENLYFINFVIAH